MRYPTDAAHRHLQRFHAEGWTASAIAGAIGWDDHAAQGVINGTQLRLGSTRYAQVMGLTRDSLFANAKDADWIPGIGAARRMQALAVAGWATEALASDQVSGRTLRRARSQPAVRVWETGGGGAELLRPMVTAKAHRAIAELFDEHAIRRPSRGAPVAQLRSKVRDDAIRAGWAPALAWDDIDDPNEKPHGGNVKHTTVEAFVEDALDLLALGVTPKQVCSRLKVSPGIAASRLFRFAPHVAGPFRTLDRNARDTRTGDRHLRNPSGVRKASLGSW